MEQPNDTVAYIAVLCLPFVAWLVSRPPVWSRLRPRLEPGLVRLRQQLTETEEPDEGVLRSWAVKRLEQLVGDLERVRRLLSDDAWMTATRQVGNRLAYERLTRDVREAEVAAAAFGPVNLPVQQAAPTPVGVPRPVSYAPAPASVVEIIEFGPTGRWV